LIRSPSCRTLSNTVDIYNVRRYGKRPEALKDDRKGRHSIRVNDQWRICFRWHGEDALDVEIVDYH
jgi:plasmid maintenance system killer protein